MEQTRKGTPKSEKFFYSMEGMKTAAIAVW